MDTKTHYLTVATFRVKDKDDGRNEVEIDDHGPDKAIIRKLCLCGSGIKFDEDACKWLCSASGTELEVWNCNPLLSRTELASKSGLKMPELQDPQSASLVRLDEKGELEVFLKIQAKDRWIISDPLPIWDYLSIKPSETDLLIAWSLNIDYNLTGKLDFTIDWNVADPVHRRTIERLAASKTIILYFLDANSLSLIGGKVQWLYQPWIQAEVTKAIADNAALSKDEHQRRGQLNCMALGHEAWRLSLIDKFVLCPEMTRALSYPASIQPVEMSKHIKTCPLCQQLQRP